MMSFARTALAASIAGLALSGCGRSSAPVVEPGSRSVLLVTIDTLRADVLRCYGFALESSPHIDALAARGVLFENAIATSTVTAPTHASIMSSRFVREHSVGAANGYTRLAGGTTLAEHFRAAGYATGAVVTNVVLRKGIALDRGFDHYREIFREIDEDSDSPRGPAEATTTAALEWIGATKAPLFLWVHYQDPHGRYTPPAPYDTRFPSVPLGSNRPLEVLGRNYGRGGIPHYQALEGVRRPWDFTRRYVGEVAYADEWFGRLLAGAEAAVGRDALVVALTSDHGESLGEDGFYFQHGHATTPDLARVPLVMAGPDVSPRRVTSVVSQVDILPTLLALAGLSPASDASGVSLVPGMLGRSASTAEERVVYSDIGSEVTAYRGDRYWRIRGGRLVLPRPGPTPRALPDDTPLRIETHERSADHLWARAAEAAPLPPEVEGYLARQTPLAAAWEDVSAMDQERMRALGYIDPGNAGLPARPPSEPSSD